MTAREGREFFTVKTVSEALTGFRPERRTPVETVALDDALGRVPAEPIAAPHALPGFARATVDGFAVRAADTYGASEGLPSYLDLAGEARMGRPPEVDVRPGTAVAIATGAPLPPGADAVLKIEHTQHATPELLEVLRPVTPGEGMVRADEDAAPGAELIRAGRPLRAQDLGMLAAAGFTEIPVHARPRVAIVSTGDELVPADPAARPAQGSADPHSGPPAGFPSARCATPPPPRSPPSFARPAATRTSPASFPTTARRSAKRSAQPSTSRGQTPRGWSRVRYGGVTCWLCPPARRSARAMRPPPPSPRSASPGIWCHGLAFRPGKPTLLADCGGVPVIGLPGNPRSALVVFRLIGIPLVRLVGGCTEPPPEPTVRARLARDLPSAAGRLDVVQVRLDGDEAEPLFGSSSLLSILTAADGYVVVPEAATGLAAGTDIEVTLYR